MAIVENVVSGLLVALIIWGARRSVPLWHRRRRRASDHEAVEN